MLKARLARIRLETEVVPLPVAGETPTKIESEKGCKPISASEQAPLAALADSKRGFIISEEGAPDSDSDSSIEGKPFKLRRLQHSLSDPCDAKLDDLNLESCPRSCRPWVRCIRNAVATTWESRFASGLKRPLRLGLGCAGLGVCVASARHIGVPLSKDIEGCDISKDCRQFLAANCPEMSRIWASMTAHAAGRGYCERAGSFVCERGVRASPDILICGTPCQPYTRNRDRSQDDPVFGCEAHPLYEATFGESASKASAGNGSCIELCQQLLPGVLLLENVPAFMMPDRVTGRKPIDKLLARLSLVKTQSGAQHFTGFHVLNLDSKQWLAQSRARTFCVVVCVSLHSDFLSNQLQSNRQLFSLRCKSYYLYVRPVGHAMHGTSECQTSLH
jgi:hypothetical protein